MQGRDEAGALAEAGPGGSMEAGCVLVEVVWLWVAAQLGETSWWFVTSSTRAYIGSNPGHCSEGEGQGTSTSVQEPYI